MRLARRPASLALLLLLGLAGCAGAPAPLTAPPASPKPDAALQSRLEQAVAGFHGDVGVYVRNLRTGQVVAIRADELFPTASMIKVPILLATFEAMDKAMGDVMTDDEMKAVLARRDLIVKHFEARTALLGEAIVLFTM